MAVRGDADEDDSGRAGRGTVEYLRRDRNGQARDSRYLLVPRDEAELMQEPRDYYYYGENRFQPWGSWGQPQPSTRPPPYGAAPRQPPATGCLFGWQRPWRNDDPRLPPSYFNRY